MFFNFQKFWGEVLEPAPPPATGLCIPILCFCPLHLSFTATRISLTVYFLANDVTLVTSYGYCQSLKINDRRTYVRCLSYDL